MTGQEIVDACGIWSIRGKPSRMKRFAVPFLCALCASGCLAKTVAPLATEHAAQTKTIAEWCRADSQGYAEAPCSKKLQDDIDAMNSQAECLEAVMLGLTCDEGAEQ